MSESSTSVSALIICATRAASRSLSPKRISDRRHRVVLVDDRHGAQLQQGVDGGAGVEMPAALLGIVERQQDLRHGDVVARQRFLIGMRQADLAGGGRGLLLFQPQRAGRQAQMAAADRDGAGGDDDHFLPARAAARDVVGQGVEPVAPDPAGLLVHQQGRADLDDQPARFAQAGGGVVDLAVLPVPVRSAGIIAFVIFVVVAGWSWSRWSWPSCSSSPGFAIVRSPRCTGTGWRGRGRILRLLDLRFLDAAEQFEQDRLNAGAGGAGQHHHRSVGQFLRIAFFSAISSSSSASHLLRPRISGFSARPCHRLPARRGWCCRRRPHRPGCRRPGGAARRSARHGRGSGAEAGAFMRALDQAGNVGQHEFLFVDIHDAQLRMQGREGIVGDLRLGARRCRQQGRFAGVGQPDQAGIGDQLQPQPDPAFLARPAGMATGAAPGWSSSCNARCRSRRRRRAAARRAGRLRSCRPARFPGRRRGSGCRPGRAARCPRPWRRSGPCPCRGRRAAP